MRPQLKMGLVSLNMHAFILLLVGLGLVLGGSVPVVEEGEEFDLEVEGLINRIEAWGEMEAGARVKRSDRGVTNLDIRDALLQMLKTMRDNNKKIQKSNFEQHDKLDGIKTKLETMTGSGGLEKKIDNISTFLLRMNNKIDALARDKGRSRGGSNILETLAQESYDIISLLPTYIDNTRKAIYFVGNDTKTMFKDVESLLVDEDDKKSGKSLKKALDATESNILTASKELKDIVVESGNMAESLFERVDNGYKELEDEIKGLANVEQVLLDTADSVMDTKRKIEFGVQQIIFKVSELIELSGGEMDDNLAQKFGEITRTILSNQTQALTNLTTKVEKEIGQVWRQMGIMYGQLSNSIGILEKVKAQTETYTKKTNKNLGSMDDQVEGLTDRMSDVDENLNYMLGQLSLVVSEFNQVKTGLGEAMEGLGEEYLEEYKKQNKNGEV